MIWHVKIHDSHNVSFQIEMGSPRGLSLVIDLGWYQSEEGQSALAHLRDPLIGTSTKFFGMKKKIGHFAKTLSQFTSK